MQAQKLLHIELCGKDRAGGQVASPYPSLSVRQNGMSVHKRLVIPQGYISRTGYQLHGLVDLDFNVFLRDLIIISQLGPAQSTDNAQSLSFSDVVSSRLLLSILQTVLKDRS